MRIAPSITDKDEQEPTTNDQRPTTQQEPTNKNQPTRTYEAGDHRCGFYRARRPRERPEFAGSRATRARIDDTLAAGAALTSGEPTRRRDLPALIDHAARKGARTTLEIDAATLLPPRKRL